MFNRFRLFILLLALTNTKSISAQECKDQSIDFTSEQVFTKVLKADYNIPNVKQSDGKLVLSLDRVTGGTRVSTLNTVHYGTIEAKMRVSSGSNVISSFILMAKNGDEIDFEFVGKDDSIIQTNFFYRGEPIYDKNAKFYAVNKRLSRSFDTYRLVWTPDKYEWWFNGFRLRTLLKSNTTKFPDSPSLVQFGIWKAPNSKWAGNGTDWSKGPYNVTIDEFKIMCDKGTTVTTSATAFASTTTRSPMLSVSSTKDVSISSSPGPSTTTSRSVSSTKTDFPTKSRDITLPTTTQVKSSTTTPVTNSTTTQTPTSTSSPKSNSSLQTTRPIVLLTFVIGVVVTIFL